jgi:hypothetical protein
MGRAGRASPLVTGTASRRSTAARASRRASAPGQSHGREPWQRILLVPRRCASLSGEGTPRFTQFSPTSREHARKEGAPCPTALATETCEAWRAESDIVGPGAWQRRPLKHQVSDTDCCAVERAGCREDAASPRACQPCCERLFTFDAGVSRCRVP